MLSAADALLALCRVDYRAYCYLVHGGRWIPGRAASWLCGRVQEFVERQTDAPYLILVLSMPPQHGKSMTVTETLPSWILGRWPRKRVIEISYNEDFAQRFGRKNKQKLEQFGGPLFGVRLAATPNTTTEYETTEGGGMISRGVLSGVTGNPGDVMIIDDPVKNRQEADSETYRGRVWEEWVDSFRTRLSSGAKVIVIQTRWHEDDLAGRLIANEPNVEVINLPCEAEPNDPLGRRPGEALAPEIGKGDDWLRQFKAAYAEGSRSWLALFQGHPTAEQGNLIRRSWWRRYDDLPDMIDVLLSVDASFKGGEDNDNVAIQAWGKRGADIYLLDALARPMDFPETLREIRRMAAKFPQRRCILIEDKANGPAAVQMLSRELGGVLAVNPEGGKVARVNAVSGYIEAGNVWLPREQFADDLIDEAAQFPQGKHDDRVDCMSQALNRLIYQWSEVPAKEKKDFLPFALRTDDEKGDGFLQW